MGEHPNLRLRDQLMARIRDEIRRRGLRQVDAAQLFRTTQPRISDVVRGKTEELSLDALVNMVAAAGFPLDLDAPGPVAAPPARPDPVVDAYRDGVDRTLIREALRSTPTERVRALGRLQRLAEEARRGGRGARKPL